MDSLIETIKSKVDVADEIGQVVRLQRSGKSLKGLCPFHSERTPSFYVFPQTQTWRCFGCNEGGDVFSFVQKYQNLEFRDTLRYLAEKAGVPLEERAGYADESEREQSAFKERLRKLNETALLWFHQMLLHAREASEARGYVQSRGISTETVIAFGLGYAPDSWEALSHYLLTQGYTERELVLGGLARARNDEVMIDLEMGGSVPAIAGEDGNTSPGDENDGRIPGGIRDYFRNRLVFPIRDIRGRVIGFGGRALGDGKPKYLNSPQTALFEKNTVLYAIDMARDAIKEARQVVIVEGYVDAVIAHQYGTKQTVACIGSAITERHIQQLKKLTKQVTLALDPDAAGSAATEHGIQEAMKGFDKTIVPVPMSAGARVKNKQGSRGIVMLEEQVDAEINIMRLPDGEDPDEVIRRDYATWLYAVEHPLPLVDYYFETKTENLNLREASGRAEAAKRLLPIIGIISDRIKRDIYVRKLSSMVGVEERVLHEELQRILRTQKSEKGIAASFTETSGAGGQRRQSQQGQAGTGVSGQKGQVGNKDEVGQEYHSAQQSEINVTKSTTPYVSIDRSRVDKIQWEDYLIGLLLRKPGLIQHVYDIIQIHDEDFTGTDTRELYHILNSFYQRGSSPSLQSVEQIMHSVPAVLQSALVRANKCVESGTPLDEAGLEKNAVQCAYRLKRTRLLQQNMELQYLGNEAYVSGDRAEALRLRHLQEDIRRQLSMLDTATSLQG